MKAHPALFEGEGKARKIEEHFPEASARGVFVRRFRPEEFSSDGVSDLGRNLRPKTPHFLETLLGGEGDEAGEGRGGQNLHEFFYNIFKFDKSGPLLASAQNYLLHSSLPLCSLLLTNCEGLHSVRLFIAMHVRMIVQGIEL